MTDLRPLIADRLRNGPRWIRSFQRVKAQLDRMIADGEAERVFPPGGAARNMVDLTDKGRKRWLISNMKRATATLPVEANDA